VSDDRLQLEASWKAAIGHVFERPELQALRAFLVQEKASGQKLYPPMHQVFNAFAATRFTDVKVVVLGQDPYPGAGQAHGLSFSVQPGVAIPRSLANIYRELQDDLMIPPAKHGHLLSWAKQGVLLLNAVLTVRANAPDSHKNQGWEHFTDAVVQALSEQREHLVFLLWGRNAKLKADRVDRGKHCLLHAAHPSPLSAHNGFFGCKHFSRCNDYLREHGIAPIDWALPQNASTE
jgi:uracil-DNA glycosylase